MLLTLVESCNKPNEPTAGALGTETQDAYQRADGYSSSFHGRIIQLTTTALLTPRVLLVPYASHHVPTYHNWMQDPDLQAATASEPLTLREEYAMQKSWRTDADKLTFIVCTPPPTEREHEHITAGREDSPQCMIGDVNLFLNPNDEDGGADDGKHVQTLIGEIEIMIAERTQQGKGMGREILLVFMWYILRTYTLSMNEYHSSSPNGKTSSSLTSLRAKIDKENVRSTKLFEGVGFKKVSETPNYFGEIELRWTICADSLEDVEKRMDAIPQLLAFKS
jgi:RimJ/RimL family protein N-acetyltransferase